MGKVGKLCCVCASDVPPILFSFAMKRIFISYRRADTAHFAGRVFDRLRHHVGSQNVFMDVDNIPLGVDFAQYIGDEISKCDVMLALIGPNWADVLAKNGTGRLDDQQDFVRIEIASALRRNIPVVPILLEGTMMPSANRLPDDLRPLAQRNALSVRHSSFHSDMDKLVSELDLDSCPSDADTSRYCRAVSGAGSTMVRGFSKRR